MDKKYMRAEEQEKIRKKLLEDKATAQINESYSNRTETPVFFYQTSTSQKNLDKIVVEIKNPENLSTETYINEKERLKILSKKHPSKKDLAKLSMFDLNKAEKINGVQNGGVTEMHYTNPTKGKKNIIKGKIITGASIFLGAGACSIPVNYGGEIIDIMIHATTGLVVGTIIFGIGAGFNAVGRIQHWYHNNDGDRGC